MTGSTLRDDREPPDHRGPRGDGESRDDGRPRRDGEPRGDGGAQDQGRPRGGGGLWEGGVLLPGNQTSPTRTVLRIVGLISWLLLSLLGTPAEHRPVAGVLVAVAGAAVIVTGTVLRRRHWLLSVLGVELLAAMGLVLTAIGPSWVGWAPVVFALFWSIIRLPGRVGLASSVALIVAMGVVGWFALGPAAVVGQLGTCMGIAVLAYSIRAARQRAMAAERLLASERAAREATERAGVLAERQRLAREIHDILAHTLSAQVVQLEGTRLLLRHGADTEAVLARVEQAQRLARDGLEETRRALDSLRGRSRPLAETLPALAADAGAGYASEGDARDLGPEASLAIVRTVQEALTNVRKHARGAATTVRLRYAPDATIVEIVDAGTAVSSSGVGSSGVGSSGVGSNGVGSNAVGSNAVGSNAIGSSGVGSNAVGSNAIGSNGVGPDPADDPPPGDGAGAPGRVGAAAPADALATIGGGYGLAGMRERAELLGGALAAGPIAGGGFRVRLRIPA